MFLKFMLGLVLIISLITDIKYRKILNIITIPTIFIAFCFYSYSLGLDGLIFCIKGFLIGLVLLLIPYLLGGMGAGDVKLMATVGALMGTSFVFYSFIYTALIGGIIALILIIKQNGFWRSIKNFFFNMAFLRGNLGSMVINKGEQSSKISFPYGVAIVLGTFCTLIWGGF